MWVADNYTTSIRYDLQIWQLRFQIGTISFDIYRDLNFLQVISLELEM